MAEESHTWTVHPFKKRQGRGILVIVIIVITGVVSYLFMESIYFGFFAMILLTFGCGKFFFPSSFSMDDSGITETYLGMKKKQEWSYFKRFYEKKEGILLSPFQSKHWLEKYRAWYIYPKNEKMLDFIQNKFNLNQKNIETVNDA